MQKQNRPLGIRALRPSSFSTLVYTHAAISCVGRLFVFGTAASYLANSRWELGAGASLAIGLIKLASQRALTDRVTSDLYQRTARALLLRDPAEAHPLGNEPEERLFEVLLRGQTLYAQTVPAILGDIAATILISIALLQMHLWGWALAAAGAVFVVFVVQFLLRRMLGHAVSRGYAAYRDVGDLLGITVHGRLEIFANAAAPYTLDRVSSAVAIWMSEKRRGDWSVVFFQRATVFAAVIGVVAAVWISRGELDRARIAQLLVIGAALPAFGGLMASGLEWMRAQRHYAAFDDFIFDPINEGSPSSQAPVDAITLNGASAHYKNSARPALDHVSLTVRGPRLVILRGANGSGKSTLLRLLLGAFPEYQGDVMVGEQEMRTLPNGLRGQIAYLPQRPYISERHSLKEALDVLPTESGADQLRAWGLLQKAEDAEKVRVTSLSGGQRQRLALARLFAQPSRSIFLLDEPESHLDEAGLALLRTTLGNVKMTAMVIVAAHTDALLPIADEIVTLELGKIIPSTERPGTR